MYDIVIEQEFSSGHQLHGYAGQCENMHGHNWKVRLEVTAEVVDEIGLGIDFTILKNILKAVLVPYDHKVLNEMPQFTYQNPTSENIARTIYQECKTALLTYPVKMKNVLVWESSKSFVRYYE